MSQRIPKKTCVFFKGRTTNKPCRLVTHRLHDFCSSSAEKNTGTEVKKSMWRRLVVNIINPMEFLEHPWVKVVFCCVGLLERDEGTNTRKGSIKSSGNSEAKCLGGNSDVLMIGKIYVFFFFAEWYRRQLSLTTLSRWLVYWLWGLEENEVEVLARVVGYPFNKTIGAAIWSWGW